MDKGTKIVIDREKDHPCYKCKYAAKRPDEYMTVLSPWFVCTKPIEERKAKIMRLLKQLSAAAEEWLDCLIAGHLNDETADRASTKLAEINCDFDEEMNRIYEILEYGWAEPVEMTILEPACHTGHQLPLFSRSEGQPLPLSEDLVSVFGQTSSSVFMASAATETSVYTYAELGNGWNPKILYAVKNGVYTSDPDDAMAYAEIVKYSGVVTKENWKKFWGGRGYKVYFNNKEL